MFSYFSWSSWHPLDRQIVVCLCTSSSIGLLTVNSSLFIFIHFSFFFRFGSWAGYVIMMQSIHAKYGWLSSILVLLGKINPQQNKQSSLFLVESFYFTCFFMGFEAQFDWVPSPKPCLLFIYFSFILVMSRSWCGIAVELERKNNLFVTFHFLTIHNFLL